MGSKEYQCYWEAERIYYIYKKCKMHFGEREREKSSLLQLSTCQAKYSVIKVSNLTHIQAMPPAINISIYLQHLLIISVNICAQLTCQKNTYA